jgi:lipoyl(octanoyl) transferase
MEPLAAPPATSATSAPLGRADSASRVNTSKRSRTFWRAIRTDPADGAFNMAVDELLMESVRSGGPPTLRLYEWAPPCLSLGRNQPGLGHYDAGAICQAGIQVVRRPTGGRAVLHDRELTYSVAIPSRTFGSARGAYREINRILLEAVRLLGVAATMQPDEGRPSPYPSTAPCFADPVAGELVAAGRKLIGSAQLCEGGVILQHGSIPLGRPTALDRLPPAIAAGIDGSPAYLTSLLGRPVEALKLAESIARTWGAEFGQTTSEPLSLAELERAHALSARYRSDSWTWRR